MSNIKFSTKCYLQQADFLRTGH